MTIRKCKFLTELSNGQEVIYALEEISCAKDHLKQLRGEINHLAKLCTDPKEKERYEKAVADLTQLYIAILITNEEIITNIETVEVEE